LRPDSWGEYDWPATVWRSIADLPVDVLFEESDLEGVLGQNVLQESLAEISPRELIGEKDDLTALDLISEWITKFDFVPDKCPHECVDDTDLCTFHLPPNNKPDEESGIEKMIVEEGESNLVGANIGTLDLQHTVIRSDTDQTLRLDFCTIDEILLNDSVFYKHLSVTYSSIGSISIDSARVRGDFDISRTEIKQELTGSHAIFYGQVYGRGADLYCGEPVNLEEAIFKRYVCFDRATLNSEIRIWNCVFEADVEFRFAEFQNSINARWADFHRFVDFHGSTFREKADFGGANFYDDAGFSEINFGGDVNFQSDYNSFKEYAAIFNGVADFTKSNFNGRLNLREVKFKKYASFKYIDVRDEATFWNTEFYEDGDFREGTFRSTVDFQWSKFRGYADFNGADFEGFTNFGGSQFNDDVGFSDVLFAGDVLFRGEFNGYEEFKSEFEGVVDFEDSVFKGTFDVNALFHEDASFAGAVFRGDVRVTAQFDRIADFSNTGFEKVVDFENTEFRNKALFDAVESTQIINMSDVLFQSGIISQPKGLNTYYDFYRATVGDIDLKPTDDERLFDYFRFCETTFEGFDFPKHGGALLNNWTIHEFGAREDDHSIAELINTYLKAKNGAVEVGAQTASAEFFIREMCFRRKKHREGITEGSIISRLSSLLSWTSNWFLNLSCRYGERPLQPVSFSALIVAVFGIVYAGLGLRGVESVLGHLIFSTQVFVALILGPPEVNSVFIRFITAIQGFVGAFFIALFVFALTRSVNR
jgi:uncharacterized protein YjbI with pentapeptide repeats